MKTTKVLKAMAIASAMVTMSMTASAGFVPLDAWQMNVPGFTNLSSGETSLTTNIGHLVLGGGSATVQQQVNASNNPFVGALFNESGTIFSVGYVAENCPGTCDSGPTDNFGNNAESFLPNQLKLAFSSVTGIVTSLNVGGGFSYVFTSGNFSVLAAIDKNSPFTTYATGSIIGIGGNTSSTNVIGGTAGDSNVLASVLNEIGSFDLFDSAGASLKTDLLTGKVLFQATTTNTLNPASVAGGGCTFTRADGSTVEDRCVTIQVTSEGAANLVRVIPEPGSMTLVGLGLFGLGMLRRRKLTVK